MSNLFWLSDEQLTAIEAAIPRKRRGVKPRRNREVISGIIHVLKIGCRWEDCPPDYGPHTTIYNRFNRWSKAGIWSGILANLVVFDATDIQCIDSTTAKAHRCAAGGKGGPGTGHWPKPGRENHENPRCRRWRRPHRRVRTDRRQSPRHQTGGRTDRTAAASEVLAGRRGLRQRRLPRVSHRSWHHAGDQTKSDPKALSPV